MNNSFSDFMKSKKAVIVGIMVVTMMTGFAIHKSKINNIPESPVPVINSDEPGSVITKDEIEYIKSFPQEPSYEEPEQLEQRNTGIKEDILSDADRTSLSDSSNDLPDTTTESETTSDDIVTKSEEPETEKPGFIKTTFSKVKNAISF